MTDVTVNLETLGRLSVQMTAAAEATAETLSNLDAVIDHRVQLALAAELATISGAHQAEVGELNRKLRATEQRHADLVTEMRRQFDRLERNYQRAAAALRASGDPEFRWGKRPDVSGEPPASEPGEQIMFWLDRLAPPAPDGRYVFLLGDVMATANPEGDLRGNETEMHPFGRSMVVPISAITEALGVVAQAPGDATALQLRVKVRNVLVGHGLPRHVGQRDGDAPQLSE